MRIRISHRNPMLFSCRNTDISGPGAQKFAGPVAQGVLDQAVQQNIPSTPPLYSPPPGALGAQEAPPEFPLSTCRANSMMGRPYWAVFGASLGRFRRVFGRLGCLLVRLGRLFSSLGCLLVRLGRPLGRLVGLLGRLGRLLGRLGPSLGRLGPSWGRLGPSLGAPGRSRGAPGVHFVP